MNKKILLSSIIFFMNLSLSKNILFEAVREVVQEKYGDFDFVPWSKLLKEDQSVRIFEQYSKKNNGFSNLFYKKGAEDHFFAHDTGYSSNLTTNDNYEFTKSEIVESERICEDANEVKKTVESLKNGSIDINHILDTIAVAQDEAKKFLIKRKITEKSGHNDYAEAKKLIIENTVSVINKNKKIEEKILDPTKKFIDRRILPDAFYRFRAIENKKMDLISFDKNNPGIINIQIRPEAPLSSVKQQIIAEQDNFIREAAKTLLLLHIDEDYKTDLVSRINQIIKILLDCNDSNIAVRILSRLKLVDLELEYPYGFYLEKTLYLMRKKYFNKDGRLIEVGRDYKLAKRMSPFLKRTVKNSYYAQVMKSIGDRAGVAAVLEWENKNWLGKFLDIAPKTPTRIVKKIGSIISGGDDVDPNKIRNNKNNQMLLEFIYRCRNWDFDNLEKYYAYDYNNIMDCVKYSYYREYRKKALDSFGILKGEDPYWNTLSLEEKKKKIKELGVEKINKILSERERERKQIKKEFDLDEKNDLEIEKFIYKLIDITTIPVRINAILEKARENKIIRNAFLTSDGILKNIADKEIIKDKKLPVDNFVKMQGINQFLALTHYNKDVFLNKTANRCILYLLENNSKYFHIASIIFHNLLNGDNGPFLHCDNILPQKNYSQNKLDIHEEILDCLDLQDPENIEECLGAFKNLALDKMDSVEKILDKLKKLKLNCSLEKITHDFSLVNNYYKEKIKGGPLDKRYIKMLHNLNRIILLKKDQRIYSCPEFRNVRRFNREKFLLCRGNLVQQFIHADFINIINKVSKQLSMEACNELILTFLDVAIDYNNAGMIVEALSINDFCYNYLKLKQELVRVTFKKIDQHLIDMTVELSKNLADALWNNAKEFLVEIYPFISDNNLFYMIGHKVENVLKEQDDLIYIKFIKAFQNILKIASAECRKASMPIMFPFLDSNSKINIEKKIRLIDSIMAPPVWIIGIRPFSVLTFASLKNIAYLPSLKEKIKGSK